MKGLQSYTPVDGMKHSCGWWKLEPQDVTKPRPDGSKYIGTYYARLTISCIMLIPGCSYVMFLQEPNGTFWQIEGKVTGGNGHSVLDCRNPPVKL